MQMFFMAGHLYLR